MRRFAASQCRLISLCTLGLGIGAAPIAGQTHATSFDTELFTLRSDPRVGLHHFLAVWAAADAGEWPGYAQPIVERDSLPQMDADDRRTWDAAIAAYASTVGRSPVFDAGLIAVRDWAAGTAARDDVPPDDSRLVEAIERALPVYEQHWWPAHDARNREWTRAVLPLARSTERDIARRVAATYGGSWPEERIPVDVVAYANDVGAYSTGGRIVTASADPAIQAEQSLEMLFHESSHTEPLESPLRATIRDAFQQEGGTAPDRFWHDVIFFVSGDATALALEAAGRPGHRHYGETAGVYARGERWPAQLRAFEEHLRPLVRMTDPGDAQRSAVFRAVARALM